MRLLVIPGALRRDSYNRKVAKLAAAAIRERGHETDELDLHEIPMPLYDGDIESTTGLPDGAKAFRARIEAAQGIFLASPEYNNSVPGVMKNAIDWASRPPAQPLRGKIVALASASPGPYGGARALMAWRPVFRLLGATIISPELSITFAAKAFNDGGELVEEPHRKQLGAVVEELIRVTAALSRTDS